MSGEWKSSNRKHTNKSYNKRSQQMVFTPMCSTCWDGCYHLTLECPFCYTEKFCNIKCLDKHFNESHSEVTLHN